MNDALTIRIVATGLIVIMAGGLGILVRHRVRTQMGFGYRFIQSLAMMEVIPAILLLAVLGIIKGEAAVAVIGTVAGYAFGLKSRTESN